MAIKRVEEVFSTTTDARRALREISIMRLCKHPNIVVLKEVHALPDAETFQNLWCVPYSEEACTGNIDLYALPACLIYLVHEMSNV